MGATIPQKERKHCRNQSTPACKIWRESAREKSLTKKVNKKKQKTYSKTNTSLFALTSEWRNKFYSECFMPLSKAMRHHHTTMGQPLRANRHRKVVQNQKSRYGTLRKKSANEPVRLGLFDVVVAALLAADTEGSFDSAGFLGLDWPICIGINIWQPTYIPHFSTMLAVKYNVHAKI